MKNTCQNSLSLYQEFAVQIDRSETGYDLKQVLRLICEQYHCEKFMVSELPISGEIELREMLIISNWVPEAIRKYDLALKKEFSELLDSLRLSVNPVFWKLPVNCDDLYDYTDNPDLENCIFFPVFDRSGRKGMIGFSNFGPKDDFELITLSTISNLIFDKIIDISHLNLSQTFSLSEREIQCLNWTALGKTSYEVGKILEISTNTVNHYLSNASRKLNCVNKTHAVAKCIQDGIIQYPRNYEQISFMH